MASMALLNEAQGGTKGGSEEERVGEAGEGWGGTGTQPREEGEQDALERRTSGGNANGAAPSKPCFLQKGGQPEDCRMRAAVPTSSPATARCQAPRGQESCTAISVPPQLAFIKHG